MNCSQARPLLAAGDPAADAHLEDCAACGDWLEAEDRVIARFRAARPESLPAPAGLRQGVLRGWVPARRRWVTPTLLGGAAAVLVAATIFALSVYQSALLVTAGEYSRPVLGVFAGPRELLLDNLSGLVGLAALSLLAMTVAGFLYRELGRPARGRAR